MFGKKNGDNQSPFSQAATTLIAPGTEVEGDLNFKGNLEIEGTIKGYFHLLKEYCP